MAKNSKHDATDAALGYYYQAIYALLILLDAADDEVVSVETGDDIEVSGSTPRLVQLKHSLGTPPALTEKNDGLWNTFSIWIPHLQKTYRRFIFVTCAEVAKGSALLQLTGAENDRADALTLLEDEAQRVVNAVAAAEHAQKKPNGGKVKIPYQERVEGCRAFLGLTQADRALFIQRLTIFHKSLNAANIQMAVEERLNNYRKAIRHLIASRLIEWWDYRVARSLTGSASRDISKDELLDRLQELALAFADDNLPDDFSLATPQALDGELGSTMEEQIRMVDGGEQRLQRAALARWKARQQRDRWLAERVGLGPVLDEYDKHLIQFWKDRHGPMRDDCQGKKDEEKKKLGLGLLDWSHSDAFLAVPRPRPKWDKAFLTQGSYQQLADQQLVGWHPDFEDLLKPLVQKTDHAQKTAQKPKGGQSTKAGGQPKASTKPKKKQEKGGS